MWVERELIKIWFDSSLVSVLILLARSMTRNIKPNIQMLKPNIQNIKSKKLISHKLKPLEKWNRDMITLYGTGTEIRIRECLTNTHIQISIYL